MAYAVTHILVPLIIISVFHHYYYKGKKLPIWVILLGGVAGLMPDLDIVLSWILSIGSGSHVDIHGSFTHSFLWPIIFAVLGLIFYRLRKQRWMQIALVTSFGWLTHILIDILYKPRELKAWTWPFDTQITVGGGWDLYTYGVHIDAILLVLWLVHEQYKHKIKDWF